MEPKDNYEQLEERFLALFETAPLPTIEMLTLIRTCAATQGESKADEWADTLMQELVEKQDFPGLLMLFKARGERFMPSLKPAGIRDKLKKSSKDRTVAGIIDSAAFGETALAESFRRVDLLLSLTPGTLVIDSAWGFGCVKNVDSFYKRVALDFTGKPNHSMTFAAACETIALARQDHLLTMRHKNPAQIASMIAERPGELVKLALECFGEMNVAKLESTLTGHAFVKPQEWKTFWDTARKSLKNDTLVVIPAKRAEPLRLLLEKRSYTGPWFANLAELKDPSEILESVLELEGENRIPELDQASRDIVGERLAFAVKAAHNTDAALYARVAATVNRLGFKTPPANVMREHLWENQRYIKASEAMTVRDNAAMSEFLLDGDAGAAMRMLDSLPQMPFSLLNEVLNILRDSPAATTVCRKLLAQPKAPPTLVNWIFRNRKTLNWPLPPLSELLGHAVLLLESRLSGESLRMQNNLKQLFANAKWLEDVFAELDTQQRQFLFERIQASSAWDPSTHHSLLRRMLKLDPSLTSSKKTVAIPEQDAKRWTSWHSLAERQAQYKRLVEIEMPRNSQDIATARSYGDLRENFEYQAAKDLQRQLLQKQAAMQMDMQNVQGTDFANASCEQAGPGTTVSIATAEGSKLTYTILGEWDRDEQLNIISNKSRLAMCLNGKKPGESVMVPSASGEIAATLEAVETPGEAIRAWIMRQPD
ncbi:MAG: GreA/GreB family elongation factor [Kiritimatiellae bacterium]|nr:GreA/GreB family elongation factor [Kiritimatiellia bacterium]